MTKLRANWIPIWCIILNLTLLQIIGITSFQFGRNININNNPSSAVIQRKSNGVRKHYYVDVVSPLHAELSTNNNIAPNNNFQQSQQQGEHRHRHAVFQHTNAVSKSFPIPHPAVWRRFVKSDNNVQEDISGNAPQSFWEQLLSSMQLDANYEKQINQLVNDVTVQFDDPAIGAFELVKECNLFHHEHNASNDKQSATLPENAMLEQEIIHHLSEVLSYFQSIACANERSSNTKCQARIVSSIGTNGIKCPRWHADHVPVRLVMSIIGPGCEYIPYEMELTDGERGVVDRNALNTLDEDDTRIANDIILPPHYLKNGKTVVTSAKEGDVVLLMGREWEDVYTHSNNEVLAAVHRSPLLSPGQERILLTVDVVPSS